MARCEAGTKRGRQKLGCEAGHTQKEHRTESPSGEKSGYGQEGGPPWARMSCTAEALQVEVNSCTFSQSTFLDYA